MILLAVFTGILRSLTGGFTCIGLSAIDLPLSLSFLCLKLITMNEERFNKNFGNSRSQRSRMLTGLFLLLIGAVLFARNAGMFFPEWLFSWPVILIVIGLFSGLKHSFRRGPWFILILIGGIFLADKVSDDLYLRPYFWPILFVAAGGYILLGSAFRRDRHNPNDGDAGPGNDYPNQPVPYGGDKISTWGHSPDAKEDTVDIAAVFSGVKRNIISKQFKGGDIVAIMGGAELNFMKADLNGKVSIDNFTMFGGTKIIVPPDWNVQNNVVAIFGGVEDKRPPSSFNDPAKILFLEGTCIFGGIEIRSY